MGRYSTNLLALPKRKSFMKCFVAPKGYNCIALDLSAIEPHVLAHFSQDPTLMKVYGKGAKEGHDIYMIAGMAIPGIRDKILPFYDIDNPVKESIDELKSREGELRKKKLKPAYLGWIYGIGAETLATNLKITVPEAKLILSGMDKQFAGRFFFDSELRKMWMKNGGYFLNGRGRPICVDRAKTRDFVSRFNQSTGHDCLVRILYHMTTEVRERNLESIMIPYIPDFHDESIWLVKQGYENVATDVYRRALELLNKELNWTVDITWGDPVIAPDLTVRSED